MRRLFFCTTLIAHIIYPSSPKLILHFDINKTIIAEDMGNNKALDDVLIQSLAKVYTGKWDVSLTEEISYVQYVKDYLVPGDKSNREIRRQRNELMLRFLEVLAINKDPRYPMIKQRFDKIREKIANQPGKIFESFYNLVSYLESHGIAYSIILRTFGTDLTEISHELAQTINLNFEWEGCFINGVLHVICLSTQEKKILTTIKDIFDFFKISGHVRIRDDFKMWNINHEKAEFGKLFPVDTQQREVRTVFFDDNVDSDILNPRDINGFFCDINELITQGMVCPVDTLQAIEDNEYFIKYLVNGV